MSTTYESDAYSFQDVLLALTGPNLNLDVTGAANEGYQIEMDGDKNTLTMGADGSGITSLHAAQNGTLTLNLLRSGICCQLLCNAYTYQTQSAVYTGKITGSLVDMARGDSYTLFGGSFRKFPNFGYAMEQTNMIWVMNFVRVSPKIGAGVGITTNG